VIISLTPALNLDQQYLSSWENGQKRKSEVIRNISFSHKKA